MLCKRIDAPKSIGSILLPEKARQMTNEVEIIAWGVDCKSNLIAGARAYIGNYAGADVELDGEKYVILPETDILAIVETD